MSARLLTRLALVALIACVPAHAATHLPGAAAIDRAEAAACTATDQRGLPRPVDGDGIGDAACDVGAVEIQRDAIFGDGFDG